MVYEDVDVDGNILPDINVRLGMAPNWVDGITLQHTLALDVLVDIDDALARRKRSIDLGEI